MGKNPLVKVIPSQSLWALAELDHQGIQLRKRICSSKEQPQNSYLRHQKLTPNTEPLMREMSPAEDPMDYHKDFAASLKVRAHW